MSYKYLPIEQDHRDRDEGRQRDHHRPDERRDRDEGRKVDTRREQEQHHGQYRISGHFSKEMLDNRRDHEQQSGDRRSGHYPKEFTTPHSKEYSTPHSKEYNPSQSSKHGTPASTNSRYEKYEKQEKSRSREQFHRRTPSRSRTPPGYRRNPIPVTKDRPASGAQTSFPGSHVPIPPAFKTDTDYLDTTKTKGYALPRLVVSTAYTEEAGFAGAPIDRLPLAAVCLGGLDNWGLRYLASGQRAYWTMSRT